MNLNLEAVECKPLLQSTLEKKYAKYLYDLSKKEFDDLLFSEEHIDELFTYFTNFVEDVLINNLVSGVIYVQTSKMLRFYKNHFKKRMMDVVFVQDVQPNIEKHAKELIEQNKDKTIPIIMTDIRDASSYFSLLSENQHCIRLMRYGWLYNEKSKEKIDLNQVLQNEELRVKCEKDYQHLYTLKFKLNDLTQ